MGPRSERYINSLSFTACNTYPPNTALPASILTHTAYTRFCPSRAYGASVFMPTDGYGILPVSVAVASFSCLRRSDFDLDVDLESLKLTRLKQSLGQRESVSQMWSRSARPFGRLIGYGTSAIHTRRHNGKLCIG